MTWQWRSTFPLKHTCCCPNGTAGSSALGWLDACHTMVATASNNETPEVTASEAVRLSEVNKVMDMSMAHLATTEHTVDKKGFRVGCSENRHMILYEVSSHSLRYFCLMCTKLRHFCCCCDSSQKLSFNFEYSTSSLHFLRNFGHSQDLDSFPLTTQLPRAEQCKMNATEG